MASESLKTRWTLYFRALDYHHDGVLNHQDVEFMRAKFAELHHLDEEKRKDAIQKFESWWYKYILKGRTDEISESDFIEMLNDEYKTDGKDAFDANMATNMHTIISLLNVNADDPEKTMTEDEFRIAYKSFGHEKIAENPESFQAFNPVNGRIPLKDYIDAWVEFITGADGPKGKLIKKQFERDGFL